MEEDWVVVENDTPQEAAALWVTVESEKSTGGTMEAVVAKTLERLVAEKKANAALRTACQEALDDIGDVARLPPVTDESHEAVLGRFDKRAHILFKPYKLACESKCPRLAEIAIDGLEKLFAFSYLVGDVPYHEDGSKRLIDVVIACVCEASEPDENVQLQIIKALLTSVTSRYSAVHEHSLNAALKTCFHICLASKSSVIQMTAKASLTQMVTALTKRMEIVAAAKKNNGQKSGNVNGSSNNNVNDDSSSATPSGVAGGDGSIIANGEQDDLHHHHEEQEHAVEAADGAVSNGVVATTTTTTTTTSESDSNKEENNGSNNNESDSANQQNGDVADGENGTEVHQSTSAGVVAAEDGEQQQQQQSEETTTSSSAAAALSTPSKNGAGVRNVIVGDNASDCATSVSNRTPTRHPTDWSAQAMELQGFEDIAEKDVYLVFKRIVKLSAKPATDMSDESIGMRSKLLSLELVFSILQSAGPVFRSHEKFISAVRQDLCLSILLNGTSQSPPVSHWSLRIFIILLQGFKMHLKNEIGLVFSNVLLRLLETAATSFQQRMSVLQVVHKLCQDAQTVVDIYVNYDCSLNHSDIFERLINDLARTLQQHSSHLAPEQELQLKTRATDTIMRIIISLVEWTTVCEEKERRQREKRREKEKAVEGNDDTPQEESVEEEIPEVDAMDASHFAAEKKKKIASRRDEAEAVNLFNEKPMKGIQHMIKLGHLEESPPAIASFLRTTKNLSKEAIGDFLGTDGEVNKSVMHAYIDALSFANCPIDVAVRRFVERSGFKLPGEAQKIDRLMEKFAERYCKDNHDAFSHADTAYLLAYAIIMLNTDADSPNVKTKMTKAEFLRQLRGADQGKDIDSAVLEGVYDRVTANPFRLRDVAVEGVTTSHSTERMAKDALREAASSLRETQERGNGGDSVFYRATHADTVRSMIQLAWCPLIAAFSVVLEESDDATLVSLCLDGMKEGIHLLSLFRLHTERDAFVSTLTKFTNLHGGKNVRAKHIEAMKTCILVAQRDGDNLNASWEPLLRCFSQLERLHLIASGAREGNMFGDDAAGLAHNPHSQEGKRVIVNVRTAGVGYTKSIDSQVLTAQEEVASEKVVGAIDGGAIDWLFANSARLSNEGIVDFVFYLVKISNEEIDVQHSPRAFCLQKIVEISYYNMSRIRIVWTRIWAILGEHFVRAGTHSNEPLAMFAIDSLKQLALKFLEKQELARFAFQSDFLNPFLTVFNKSNSPKIRELVIECVTQLCRMRSSHIKSGWSTLLEIAGRAARVPLTNPPPPPPPSAATAHGHGVAATGASQATTSATATTAGGATHHQHLPPTPSSTTPSSRPHSQPSLHSPAVHSSSPKHNQHPTHPPSHASHPTTTTPAAASTPSSSSSHPSSTGAWPSLAPPAQSSSSASANSLSLSSSIPPHVSYTHQAPPPLSNPLPSKELVYLGYELAYRIAVDYLHLIGDTYLSCLETLLVFSQVAPMPVCRHALYLVQYCIFRLAQGSKMVDSKKIAATVASSTVSASSSATAAAVGATGADVAGSASNEQGGEDGNQESSTAASASAGGDEASADGHMPLPLAPAEIAGEVKADGNDGQGTGGQMTALSFSESEMDLKVWFRLLTGLSRIVAVHNEEVMRGAALLTMMDVLKQNGMLFSHTLWELIFNGVLFPLLDDLKHVDDMSPPEQAWLRSTGALAINCLVDLMVAVFPRVRFAIPPFASLLASVIPQPPPSAQIGIEGLSRFVREASGLFEEAEWETICRSVAAVVVRTNVEALKEATENVTARRPTRRDDDDEEGEGGGGDAEDNGNNNQEDGGEVGEVEIERRMKEWHATVHQVAQRSETRQAIVSVMHEVVNVACSKGLHSVVESFLSSATSIAHSANAVLTHANTMHLLQTKGLAYVADRLRVEEWKATTFSLSLLFVAADAEGFSQETRQYYNTQLISRCGSFLGLYNNLGKEKDGSEGAASTNGAEMGEEEKRKYGRYVLLILEKLLHTDDALVRDRVLPFFGELCTLIETGDSSVRSLLRQLMAEKVAKLVLNAAAANNPRS